MSNTKSSNNVASSSQHWSISDASQTGLDFGSGVNFSISFWMKSSSTGVRMNPLEKGSSGANDAWYGFFFGTDDVIHWTVDDGTTRPDVAGNDVIDGAWHHIVGVRDADNDDLKIYIDGSLINTTNNAAVSNDLSNPDPFYIGARNSDGSLDRYYDGLIDEISVWQKTLSLTDVQNLYNSGDGTVLEGDETDLNAYWRFEDDGLDTTANNNDLTNNNSITFSTDVPFAGGTAYTEQLEESIIINDSIVTKVTAKVIAESIDLLDSIKRSSAKGLTESISLVDICTKQLVSAISLDEIIKLTDLKKIQQTVKSIKESITLVDKIENQSIISKAIQEIITLVDTVTNVKQFFKSISETIGLTDLITKILTSGILLTEKIGFKDKLFGLLNGINMKYNNKYTDNPGTYTDKYDDNIDNYVDKYDNV